MGRQGRIFGAKHATLFFVSIMAGAAANAAQPQSSAAIPAQSAADAITTLARQTGTRILFDYAQVSGVRSNPVRRISTPRATLEELLRGTGLEVAATASGTLIVRKAARSRVPERSSSAKFFPGAAVVEIASAEQAVSEEPEILVTGSRLRQVEWATPVTAFKRSDIERLGVSSIADVLNYLPQQTFSFGENFNFGGAKAVQLRGLGLGTTLVLINGRRAVTSALQGSRSFFDINTIPLAAVERVEILSNSASAVYGADAVAGVVNIILKDKIERPTVDLYYGFTPEGGSDEKRASLGLGFTKGGLRGGVTLDHFERTPLFGAERDFAANQDFRRFGSIDARSALANPGTVFSTTTSPLPGLNSTFAAVPRGSSGVGLTPSDFVATAGTRNLESVGRYSSLIPEARRSSAVAFAELDLGDEATAFAEVLHVQRQEARFQQPPSLSNALVPASNAFNPFGVPVRVNFLLTGIGPREDRAKADFTRVVAGFRGQLQSWKWEVAGLLTHDVGSSRVLNNVDPLRQATALASSDPATALNPFMDGPGGSPALLRSLVAAPIVDRYGADARQLSGILSSSLLSLPAGDLEFAFGGEARKETIDFNSKSFSIVVDARRDSAAAFGEVRVPLVAESMDVPLVHRLAATAAARYDHYDDVGGTFNPQLGVEWEVDPALLLRASYGTSFRPPALFELYQPDQLFTGVQQIADPRRGGEIYSVDLRVGGNRELQPEEANSLSLGFLFRPAFLKGLRLSGDHWKIDQNLRVQRFTAIDVLLSEDVFPDRVIRLAPSPADIAAGWPGRVQQIDSTSLNFGRIKTSGFDFRADYNVTTSVGTFQPSLTATYIDSYKAADFPNRPAIERAGAANGLGVGSIPRWKAVGSLTWNWSGLQLSTTGRYTGKYKDANLFGVRTGRVVKGQLIVDAQLGVTIREQTGSTRRWLNGLTLRAGAINLFNASPRFSELGAIGGIGYDPSLADVRQRFLYLNVGKVF